MGTAISIIIAQQIALVTMIAATSAANSATNNIEEKVKSGDSNIKSAFLKGNIKEHLLIFYNELISSIPHNEIIKVKLEVDVNPPEFAAFENKFRLYPHEKEITLDDVKKICVIDL